MQEVKEYFLKYHDDGYVKFNKKLNVAVKKKCFGVRIPIIREYATILTKKYSLKYLIDNINNDYYEEILLKGFIIGKYQNLTYHELVNYIDKHLEDVCDWSMTDTFVSSLKITKKYLDELWPYLLQKICSKHEFEVRFALVMLLNYYINDTYQNKIYDVISMAKNEEYYVKMANAWLLSYMIISYFDDTLKFIRHNKFDQWTIAKGITKAIESKKIDNSQKEVLRKLRNEINNVL